MKICQYTDVKPAEEAYATGVSLRWTITEADGAPHFAMRVIDVDEGASTQHHEHWWEHEVFVLAGSGYLRMNDGNYPMREGTVILISGGEKHQIVNDGKGTLRFICSIPHTKLKGFVNAEEADKPQDLC
jgi:quercetin dioxygenase-like cupin family protein